MPPPGSDKRIISLKSGKVKRWYAIEKKKMGRPTDAPKSHRESFRLSEADMVKIRFCMEATGLSKTDIIRKGIDKLYTELI